MEDLNFYNLVVPSIIFAVCCCLLISFMLLKKMIVKKHNISDKLVSDIRAPIQVFTIITALYVTLYVIKNVWNFNPILEHAHSIFITICFGLLAIKAINLISSILLYPFDLNEKDNILARKVHTQVRIIRRLSVAFVVFLVMVGILITFDSVRAHGKSILASAGLISIIVGLAAQKTLGNFFAGIQIAIAQPIRVDDVVVVENEWGRIEKISLTFVVVKLWDLRRLVVPITHFTEQSFQNWTKEAADILGTVMLYVDYTMPVELIREELDRVLQGNYLWDGKVKKVQVTNATEQVMEIRILTSSVNSGNSFELRCMIREHMINFIQKNQPTSLPRVRAEVLNGIKTKGFLETIDIPESLASV